MPRPAEPPRLQLRREKDRPPIWLIVWSENGSRRRRSTGTGDKREAHRILQTFRSDIKPDLAYRPVDEILIGDILDHYAEDIANHAQAPERIGYALRRLIPFWAGLNPLDVDRKQCADYAKRRRSGLIGPPAADGTIRRELGTLIAALNFAAETRIIPAAPKVRLPKRPEPRTDWLTRRQVARLIRAARAEPKAKSHLPWFILIAYYTGGRKAAVLSLRWRPSSNGGHIDLGAGRINLNPRGRVQTKKRRSLIPIPPNLKVLLHALAKRGNSHVIADPAGHQLADIRRSFAGAAERAGVSWATPHTLRHSCITQMLINGVEPYDVSTWCSISLDELERTYGHHAPEFLSDAADSWRANRIANGG